MRHPSRILALFAPPRLIDDEHSLSITQRLDDRRPEVIPALIGIPRRPPSQMRDPLWRGIPRDCGYLLPVIALDWDTAPPGERPTPGDGLRGEQNMA